MTERKSVLIGDEDSTRADWLSQFLNDYYNADSKIARNADEVFMLARKNQHSVYFITDSLPSRYDRTLATPTITFSQVELLDSSAKLVCIVTGETPPDLGLFAPHSHIYLSSVPPDDQELTQIDRALRILRDRLPRTTITYGQIARLTKGSHPGLKQQISSLSNERNLKAGWHHFHRILRECIDFENVKSVLVEPLTQGKSGAFVFRLNVHSVLPGNGGRDKRTRELVLKLSHTEDLWKLQSEVRGYLGAAKTNLYSEYKKHVPSLHLPQTSTSASAREPLTEEFKFIASSLPWDAIHYDFLGGKLGECMSLETALLSSAEKIRKRTANVDNPKWHITSATDLNNFRKAFLSELLNSLCNIWYLNKAFTSRGERVLWSRTNAEDRTYPTFPPYKFNKRTKHWLQEFLNGDDAGLGARLFKDWDSCRDRLLAFTNDGRAAISLGYLGLKHPVILSSVHGDLNSGNAFLWLREEGFPFLIDLPFYQSNGHVMQDFARLEVELKFTLMDRQEESPATKLAAYDLSPEQVPIWRELENHLLRAVPGRAPRWKSDGFVDNVRLTYELVTIIRSRAQQVHAKFTSGRRSLDFKHEYLPALLYHTMRAATYPSLSIFKRLLAVYSAGSILKELGFNVR